MKLVTKNIVQTFFSTAERLKTAPCAHFWQDGVWKDVTWAEVDSMVRGFSSALISTGFQPGQKALIIGETSLNWVIADFAVLAAGGVVVPLYPTLTAESIARIISETQPAVAIVGEEKGYRILLEAIEILDHSSNGMKIISMNEDLLQLESISSLVRRQDDEDLERVEAVLARISPDEVATIVFTSGTTGDLKGVVLSHRNLVSEIVAIQGIFNFCRNEIGLLWLPLAHVLGRMMEFYQFTSGCQTAFVSSIDKLPQAYIDMQPHFVCGVPRMLEKIHERILARVSSLSLIRRTLFRWAIEVAEDSFQMRSEGRESGILLKIKRVVAELTVLRRIRAGLGGRICCFVCGGATLKEDIARFFYAIGLPVLEGYGLTETFSAVTVNRFDDFQLGTVGKPLSNAEIKIADDGEILIRGSALFMEYLNRPEESAKSFDDDGWFKTGDLGTLTPEGFLKVTGRRKEIIVTSGGKNISPQRVEGVMTQSPHIKQFMVYGEGRKYLVGIVVIDKTEVARELSFRKVLSDDTLPLSEDPEVNRLISDEVAMLNKKLASHETIKKFRIIGQEFTVDGGELTPTMKLRRDFIARRYNNLLLSMY